MIDIAASVDATTRQHAEGCVKISEDLDRYRRVIEDVNPTVIVECGTFSGKSALWFALYSDAKVITVDCTDNVDPDTATALDELEVVRLSGSSVDPAIVAQIHDLACRDYGFGHDFSYPTAAHETIRHAVMVVLDSDHSGPHVLAEMHAYADLVTSGSYMVVEDGILRWMDADEQAVYDGNPLDAIEEWLRVHGSGWSVDSDLEALHPVTQFPSGWLRRD